MITTMGAAPTRLDDRYPHHRDYGHERLQSPSYDEIQGLPDERKRTPTQVFAIAVVCALLIIVGLLAIGTIASTSRSQTCTHLWSQCSQVSTGP